MKNPKNQRIYGLLVTVTVVLLLVAQLMLQHAFKNDSMELVTLTQDLNSLKNTVEARSRLVNIYHSLERASFNPSKPERVNPENALALYAVLDGVLKKHSIDLTNSSPSSGTAPGGILTLQISFNGPYYGLLKALAELREAPYVMRVSGFALNADTREGFVNGSMTILSTARS